jgi:uncharacterized MAPEG superfamily protein
MTKLLSLVICTAGLTWLTAVLAMLLRARAWTPKGLMTAFGNRDNLEPASPLAGRAERTARNTLENFVLFAAIALVAHAAGAENARVTFGAEIFFWARLVYIPVYYAGIPVLRTAVWGVSIAGLVYMLGGMF